jgi:hypothetical protein
MRATRFLSAFFPGLLIVVFLLCQAANPSAANAQSRCTAYKKQLALAKFSLTKAKNRQKRGRRVWAAILAMDAKHRISYETSVANYGQSWCKIYYVFVDALGAPALCIGAGIEVGAETPWRELVDSSKYPELRLMENEKLKTYLRLKYGDDLEVSDGDPLFESKAERQLRLRKEAAIAKLKQTLNELSRFVHNWNIENSRIQNEYSDSYTRRLDSFAKSYGSIPTLELKLVQAKQAVAAKTQQYEACRNPTKV